MRRLPLSFLFSSSLALAAFACGGISDPTRGSERVATVSGALTGTSIPANARVAVVWRNGAAGGLRVGDDTAVVGGKFTLTLATPPDAYFTELEGRYSTTEPAPAPIGPGPAPEPAPPSSGSSGSSGASSSGSGGGKSASALPFASTLSPRDTTVGGSITQPLEAALAGFVVYADANGNGKLDLEGPNGSSPDTILGGNDDLILVYLRDGGSLDYEKLRDKAGILPAAGYNLAWEEGRWLPLNVVELKLRANIGLPSGVCSGAGDAPAVGSSTSGSTGVARPTAPANEGSGSGSSSGGSSGSGGGAVGAYPPPGSPGLYCSEDGRSFSYSPPCGPTEPPPPPGLCSGGIDYATPGCMGYGTAIPDGAPIPEGWPCPVTDGGLDSGVDGGEADGGAADGGAADGGAADGGAGG